jgi:hypothetical protein
MLQIIQIKEDALVVSESEYLQFKDDLRSKNPAQKSSREK